MAYEHSGIVTLAEMTYKSFQMKVASVNGALKLFTIDLRSNEVLAPVGLRRYREARFGGPTYVLSGNFDQDSEIAREWLDQKKAHIRDLELDRPQDQTIH